MYFTVSQIRTAWLHCAFDQTTLGLNDFFFSEAHLPETTRVYNCCEYAFNHLHGYCVPGVVLGTECAVAFKKKKKRKKTNLKVSS